MTTTKITARLLVDNNQPMTAKHNNARNAVHFSMQKLDKAVATRIK